MALARWIGGTFLVASLALFPVSLVAELVFRKHHPWKLHLLVAAGVALVIGAVVAAAAWLGLKFPHLPSPGRASPGRAPGVTKDATRGESLTAQGVAALRAAHQLVDDLPRILDDPVSVRLVGPEFVSRITADPERLRDPQVSALRCHVLLRSRYAEDRLALCVQAGVRQCVIIGAGLDTFAYRQPPEPDDFRVFEVDHRASQKTKRELLAKAAIAIPTNLTYVELDVEKLSLRDTLVHAGVDPARPAFFSCLGVLVYLTRDAGRDVFRTVAGFPAGSELVCTYTGSVSSDDDPAWLASRAKTLGEPWLSGFSAEELVAELRDAGFHAIEFLTREQAARYVGSRRDGLEPPRRVRIVSARV
jgi:methyltransferase (TIGR00027 family)